MDTNELLARVDKLQKEMESYYAEVPTCIQIGHKIGLQNAEQLSVISILRRFPQICLWYRDTLKELSEAKKLLQECLSVMPVGYIPTHTVENLPQMIGDLARELANETTLRENLEKELAIYKTADSQQYVN